MQGYRMLHTTINHSEKELVIPGILEIPDSIRNSFEYEGERYEWLGENDMSRKNKLKSINHLNINNDLTR